MVHLMAPFSKWLCFSFSMRSGVEVASSAFKTCLSSIFSLPKAVQGMRSPMPLKRRMQPWVLAQMPAVKLATAFRASARGDIISTE
jgi:hypothetical protein